MGSSLISIVLSSILEMIPVHRYLSFSFSTFSIVPCTDRVISDGSTDGERNRRLTLNPRYQGCIGSSSSPAIFRLRLATMSEGL